MSISIYDFCVPALTLGLTNLSTILDKAASHEEIKKINAAVLPQLRLIPDMFPLARQVQITCDTAKGAAARLAGIEIPKHPDTETTLPELKARISMTLDFIKSVKPDQMKDAESREVVLQFPNSTLRFTGLSYLTAFVLPNFYFHECMVYALLRKSGVDIGKMDYLGAIQ